MTVTDAHPGHLCTHVWLRYVGVNISDSVILWKTLNDGMSSAQGHILRLLLLHLMKCFLEFLLFVDQSEQVGLSYRALAL